MDDRFKKDRFESVSIKASVAKKFRRYSKKISKSQSMTLLLMIEFFERNGIPPEESIGPHIQTLENLIKKRMNGMISIIKDIEKSQTKPTAAMMSALFQVAGSKLDSDGFPEKKKVRFQERKKFD